MGMKKFIVVPDSFKGTLTSKEICGIMKDKILEHYPSAEVITLPVADGGEGSVDCFLSAVGGELIKIKAKNPLFEEIDSFYGLIGGGKTAVVEMAAAAGLPLIEDRKNPLIATTYGVGELMLDAVRRGACEIILGLGGSATNDFGCGAAARLGVRFYDESGESFIPTGKTLMRVQKIDASGVLPEIKNTKITLMCDVKNPVFGERGAAYVYAPQKGASADDVMLLDSGLRHITEVVARELSVDVSTLAGGGAAGAMAAGMVAFFGAEIKMGIDAVLDAVDYDKLLSGADAVFTGEGKLDSQSLEGKVIYGVASRAKKCCVPVIALVGGIDGDVSEIYRVGVNSVFSINRMPEDFSTARYKSRENLAFAFDNLLRILKI